MVIELRSKIKNQTCKIKVKYENKTDAAAAGNDSTESTCIFTGYKPPAPAFETGGEDDPNREDRVVRTGFRAEDMAQGLLPEDVPQIDEPEKISREGTEITPDDPRYFMQDNVEDARAGTVTTGSEDVSTDTSREADLQGIERETTRMEPIARTSDVMVRGQETRARGINENLRGWRNLIGNPKLIFGK